MRKFKSLSNFFTAFFFSVFTAFVLTLSVTPLSRAEVEECRSNVEGDYCSQMMASDRIEVYASRFPDWLKYILEELKLVGEQLMDIGYYLLTGKDPKDKLIGDIAKKAAEAFKLPCQLPKESAQVYVARAIISCNKEVVDAVNKVLPGYTLPFRVGVFAGANDICIKQVNQDFAIVGVPVCNAP